MLRPGWFLSFLPVGVHMSIPLVMLSLTCLRFPSHSYETQQFRYMTEAAAVMSTGVRRPVVPYSRRARQESQALSGRTRRALAFNTGVADESDQVITSTSHMNLSLFVPEASSSTDRWSTYSAPDELMTPVQHDPYLHLCTRNPEHRSGTAMRRMHSTTAVPDRNTFASDEDFVLFAFATTGLGSEQPFAPMTPEAQTSSLDFSIAPSRASVPCRELPSPREDVSPITPATHEFSSFLDIQRSSLPHYSGATPTSQPCSGRGPSQIAASYSSHCDVSPLEDDVEINLVGYDERPPPGYEESQGQIQSDRRLEAARRAQELQRRWRLSGSRRGC